MNALTDDADNTPAGNPPGGVIYEIDYTDEHIMGLWRHLRQSKRRSRMFMRVFRVVAGVALVGLIVLVVGVGRWQHWYLAVALLGILGVLVFSEQLDGWLVIRRWRKALHRNKRTRFAFTPEGLSAVSDLGQSVQRWAAFTSARRFPAGFLIFSGPYIPYWLPDASLAQGTPDDAAALFKANIPDHKRA